MLPFEFTVEGPPISHQTRHAARLRAWQQTVLDAAKMRWPAGQTPWIVPLRLSLVYYHDSPSVRIDNDNLLKPIQDALIGLIYADDKQITDTLVRKTDLNGSFRVKGMSIVLAEAFSRGVEFIFVRIETAPSHEDIAK